MRCPVSGNSAPAKVEITRQRLANKSGCNVRWKNAIAWRSVKTQPVTCRKCNTAFYVSKDAQSVECPFCGETDSRGG